MYVMITTDSRIKPREEPPTGEERIKLHQSMIAYAGTYIVESEKVTHHLDFPGTRLE
jgi:Lipocalin-like domain